MAYFVSFEVLMSNSFLKRKTIDISILIKDQNDR